MFCQSCGMEVASTYKMCPKCGGKQFGAKMRPDDYPPTTPSDHLESKHESDVATWPFPGVNTGYAAGGKSISTGDFASFWRRLGAYMIDGFLLSAIQLVLLAPAIGGAVLSGDFEAMIGALGIVNVISLIVVFLYFPLMHSSKYQATFGKKWLGIKVVDESGQRISIARAFGRFFAYILSFLTFYIGFLMIFFTERRQALHDKIAKTCVVYSGR